MENLKVIENELVPVYETSEGEKVVYGSDLHKVLGVKSNYREWVNRRFKDCDAQETLDYEGVEISTPGNPTPKKDYIILLDIAKEMAMLERNDKGKEVRRYFIEIEKKYKSNMPMSRDKLLAMAFIEANKVIEEQNQKIEVLETENKVQAQQIAEMNPKASYYDEVLKCDNALTITEIAKDYGWPPQQMNKFLKDNKVQYKTASGVWLLYQKYADKGYTKSETYIVQTKNGDSISKLHTKWTQKGRLFIYELMKSKGNLPTIEQ